MQPSTSWGVIRGVVEDVLGTCVGNPDLGVAGGLLSVVQLMANGGPTRRSDLGAEEARSTVSMHLQETFHERPRDACAWKVVSSHDS